MRVSGVKVICLHGHVDHSGRECVEIDDGDCGFSILEVPSFHDDMNGALRGPNTIFVITSRDSGEKLVHLGDLGHFPNDKQMAAISDAARSVLILGDAIDVSQKASYAGHLAKLFGARKKK